MKKLKRSRELRAKFTVNRKKAAVALDTAFGILVRRNNCFFDLSPAGAALRAEGLRQPPVEPLAGLQRKNR
jgi:hypothetical protein